MSVLPATIQCDACGSKTLAGEIRKWWELDLRKDNYFEMRELSGQPISHAKHACSGICATQIFDKWIKERQ